MDIDWAELGTRLNDWFVPGSIDPGVSLSHSGETITLGLSIGPSATPATWQLGGQPGGEPVPLSIAYRHASSDNSQDDLHLVAVVGSFAYAMVGQFALMDQALVLTLIFMSEMDIDIQIAGTHAGGATGTVVDYEPTISYNISGTAPGEYKVTASVDKIVDNSEQLDYSWIAQRLDLSNDPQQVAQALHDNIVRFCDNLSSPELCESIADVLNGH